MLDKYLTMYIDLTEGTDSINYFLVFRFWLLTVLTRWQIAAEENKGESRMMGGEKNEENLKLC